MESPGVIVEIAAGSAIPFIEPIVNVLRCMRMDDVEEDEDTQFVSSINQILQIVRGPATTESD